MPFSSFGTQAACDHCSTCKDRYLPYFIMVNELQFAPLGELGYLSPLAGSCSVWCYHGS